MFTLIELLVVIVIIGMLLSLGVVGYSAAVSQQNESVTEARMHQLEVALERFQTEYQNQYFNGAQKDENGNSIDNSEWADVDGKITIFKPCPNGIYKSGSSSTQNDGRQRDFGLYKFCSRTENERHELAVADNETYIPTTFLGDDFNYQDGYLDGWGNDFHYRYPAEHTTGFYDLWSRGADGAGLKPSKNVGEGDEQQNETDDIVNWK